MRKVLIVVAGLALAAQGCTASTAALVVGAVYPTGGGQGEEAIEEYRGVLMAAERVNAAGGIGGRRVEVVLERAETADAAPGAVRRLADRGIELVVGSYGSTISAPAAAEAARQGMVFWETGAVGEMTPDAKPGERFFRMAATGGTLGRAGVRFVADRLLPELGVDGNVRYAVAYVDDVYGRSVGLGAIEEIESSGLTLAGTYPYDLATLDVDDLARRMDAAGTEVLVVAAYLEDGVDLRRAVLERGIDLAASIGTSSSYCMPDFGIALGEDAVGLFASDKPEADFLQPEMLSEEAGKALRWVRTEYRRRHGEAMSGPGLAGFAGALALFEHVLPRAGSDDPDAVADAARQTRLPLGALPNGSGMRFAPEGHAEAGANLHAASVIWEWVAPEQREVVWPPALATAPILAVRP
ncbi:MAG TPA: ABC transporter substrate-binding protein [Actinomycetota bacterium]|nr:ABC transporter substrate-binding protein [Actinomycetota bacterium]